MRCPPGLRPTLAALLFFATTSFAASPLPDLRVADNRRFLVTSDGQPFLWLGDTAWELFHRLDRAQATTYLDTRRDQGFTVIQAVALAELDGLRVPNAYGHFPLIDLDPTKPDLRPGPDNDYWDHVDWIIRSANERGLRVALLPTWGDKWNLKWGVGPEIFTPVNAALYGEWLGRRYRDAALIWVVGGDRPIENDTHRAIVDAMARGLRRGDGGRHLITYHPSGGRSSAEYFHDAEWLDFNMRQNGHSAQFEQNYRLTRFDYDRIPAKPVLDGEPIYESHPIAFKAQEFGISVAADTRRAIYWDLFTGAFGHTYGHHSVWQMWEPGRAPVNNPLLPWTAALAQPGATQIKHAGQLLLSRPFLTRVPDDSLVIPENPATSVPGAGRYRFVATRDREGTYAMIYVPVGRSFRVNLSALTGQEIVAWWFNPRDGRSTRIGSFPNTGEKEFISPEPGETTDWVLVLDDAANNYPAPGAPLAR